MSIKPERILHFLLFNNIIQHICLSSMFYYYFDIPIYVSVIILVSFYFLITYSLRSEIIELKIRLEFLEGLRRLET